VGRLIYRTDYFPQKNSGAGLYNVVARFSVRDELNYHIYLNQLCFITWIRPPVCQITGVPQ